MNTALLKGKIVSAGYTQKSLAEKIHRSPSNLSMKISGHTPFNLNDVKDICEALAITDPADVTAIFLS